MLLLLALAGAGVVMVAAITAFVWSGTWRRATWLGWHRSQVEGCKRTSLGRGATELQASRYCACLAHEVEGRWSVAEYRRYHERALRTLEEDGTLDRCSAGGPPPPAGATDEPDWRRRTWEPWLGYEVGQCASQPSEGSSDARRLHYCECLYAVIRPRWSMREYRAQYADAMRALQEEGTVTRCWEASAFAPTTGVR